MEKETLAVCVPITEMQLTRLKALSKIGGGVGDAELYPADVLDQILKKDGKQGLAVEIFINTLLTMEEERMKEL